LINRTQGPVKFSDAEVKLNALTITRTTLLQELQAKKIELRQKKEARELALKKNYDPSQQVSERTSRNGYRRRLHPLLN
tara:strand:+ start:232 stop:468 length:237 start_codon:yes stop_codon:yes gene_type:complete